MILATGYGATGFPEEFGDVAVLPKPFKQASLGGAVDGGRRRGCGMKARTTEKPAILSVADRGERRGVDCVLRHLGVGGSARFARLVPGPGLLRAHFTNQSSTHHFEAQSPSLQRLDPRNPTGMTALLRNQRESIALSGTRAAFFH